MPYPLTFSHREYDTQGALIGSTSGSSTGPSMYTSWEGQYWYDQVTGEYVIGTQDRMSDAQEDADTGTAMLIEGYRFTRADNGQNTENRQAVDTWQHYGHQVYIATYKNYGRYDPNVDFDYFEVTYASSYLYPLPVPATVTTSARAVVNFQDAAGETYLNDTTIPITQGTPTSWPADTYCFNYTYDDPFGFHSEGSGCNSSSAGGMSTDFGNTGN
jgi:hypothetical protein